MDFFFHPYRVSEIAQHLRDVLTRDAVLSDVWIQGELSECKRAASGHFYFSLKDESACLRGVMWRREAARLTRAPREGDAVYVHGAFSLYEARGDVQVYADEIQFLGAGYLYQQFEALKQRLEQEGLFAAAHKRALPKFPQRIGIITSREGAVLHDILHILRRRFPLPEIFLVPCAVQGNDAPPQIVNALNALQRVENLDVIILARGGGSLEDLWCFNDERVARAIYHSRVPVVSGVGHETDFTIADFCADLRAPTPTAAAQFCTPDQNELRANVMLYERRLHQAMRAILSDARHRWVNDVNALQRASPRAQIMNRRQQIDERTRATAMQLRRRLTLQRERLRGAQRHLAALNPAATLERGYAIVYRDARVITSPAQVRTNDALRVRVREGEFGARVE